MVRSLLMAEHIRYHVDGKVGTITIDRPEKRNAMTYAMLRDFIAAVGEADADSGTVVVIITGVPGAFCAGTDLADLASVPGESRGLRGTAEDRHAWWPITECSKPTICAIDGPAVGMGAEFTSQCDIRLASPNARFAWNFVHRGLVPDTGAGTWLLPRIIGLQPALKLLYTGAMIDAVEAQRLGYVTEVVDCRPVAGRRPATGRFHRGGVATQSEAREATGLRRHHSTDRRAHAATTRLP